MLVRHAQSYLTLQSHRPLDSSVHGILQARILDWIAGEPFSSPGDVSNPEIEPGCRQILYWPSHQGSPIYSCSNK